MCLRIFSITAGSALLAACGLVSAAPEGPDVECAIGAGAQFSAACTLELIAKDEFVIHHPGGGFRRFVWSDDGILAAADGVEAYSEHTIIRDGETIEISIEGNSYRVPVTLVSEVSYE